MVNSMKAQPLEAGFRVAGTPAAKHPAVSPGSVIVVMTGAPITSPAGVTRTVPNMSFTGLPSELRLIRDSDAVTD